MADQDQDRIEGEEPANWDQAQNHAAETVDDVATDTSDRLDLEEEDRLPWLDSDYDDDGNTGVDNGRILGFVLLGLVALAAIVGGIWWASHRQTDPNLVADGSLIQASDAPYKEAPKDPGGKTFAGTGDTSFAVSEGQTRAVKLGEGAAAPAAAGVRPSIDLGAKPGAAPVAGAAGTDAPAAGGVGVQVAAFSTQATAEAGWGRLVAQHSALSGVPHRVVEGKADIGTVYRLQAVVSDAAGANALCSKLKAAGLNCQVKN
jgi:hypothetical protein